MPVIELALVICNQREVREKIAASALKCGLAPISCCNLTEAKTLLPQDGFRVVLTKDVLPDGDFRSVLREAKRSSPGTPVIVLSQSADWDSYLKAIGVGAFDYILCPPNPLETERIIWMALAETIGAEQESIAIA